MPCNPCAGQALTHVGKRLLARGSVISSPDKPWSQSVITLYVQRLRRTFQTPYLAYPKTFGNHIKTFPETCAESVKFLSTKRPAAAEGDEFLPLEKCPATLYRSHFKTCRFLQKTCRKTDAPGIWYWYLCRRFLQI